MFVSERHFLTSESVTEGHPDKVADQIADAILDDLIAQDARSRVACEVLVTTGLVCIVGEITTEGYCNFRKVARDTIREIGYDNLEYGFEADTCGVVDSVDEQSPDIAQGVNVGGAGDQGMMFGFAVRETRQLMPAPITLAHRLVRRLAEVRKAGGLWFLRPDGKSQVTLEYEDDRPVRVDSVVVSCQHSPEVSRKELEEGVREEVIRPALPEGLVDARTKYYINPTGRFVVGGPVADAGMSGRKIIVDTYGGWGRHGGGSFSGKDPTKVDRSASYMARYVAKNIVAAGIADKCEVHLAYAIGVVEPVCIKVETFGTGGVNNGALLALIQESFDLTPLGMIETLNLRRPIYRPTAAYGHFGREEPDFTWEVTDKAQELRDRTGLKGPVPERVGF
jgi:S-adenosylmethionine synthetase